jgi:hypothetical protein
MASDATSVLTLQQVRQPELPPPSPWLAPVKSPAPEPGENGLRPLEVAACSMCGVTLPLALLVPDGSQACADIRWYCKDVKSCTERWTTALPQSAEAPYAEARSVTSVALSRRYAPPSARRPARRRRPGL